MTLSEIDQRLEVIRRKRRRVLLGLLRNQAADCRWRRIVAILEARALP